MRLQIAGAFLLVGFSASVSSGAIWSKQYVEFDQMPEKIFKKHVNTCSSAWHVVPVEQNSINRPTAAPEKEGFIVIDAPYLTNAAREPQVFTSPAVYDRITAGIVAAIKQTGCTVTVGPAVPESARYVVRPKVDLILAAHKNFSAVPGLVASLATGLFVYSSGTNPWVIITNSLNIEEKGKSPVIFDKMNVSDYSSMHFTVESGYERAINGAIEKIEEIYANAPKVMETDPDYMAVAIQPLLQKKK